MGKEKIPTVLQAQTLKGLIEGRRLVIGKWHTGEERIYWEFGNPGLIGTDKIDCSPRRKRYYMGFLERYGWVVQTKSGWEITKEGRKAVGRYNKDMGEVSKRLGLG